jgi:hypothetical protein
MALTAVVTLVLTGCGTQESPVTLLAAAGTQTQEAGTAQFSLTQDFEGGPIDGQSVEATGAIDFAEQRGHLEFDLSSLAPTGTPAAGNTTFRAVFDGTTVYMQLPIPGLPTPWVVIDASELEGLEGLEQLNSFSNDPTQTFAFLKGASDDIEEVGTEDVRDASTTHYRMTVNLEQAAEEAPEEAKKFLEQQIEVLGTDELPMDVWLDDEGRVRRQSFQIDLSQLDLEAAGATPPPGAPSEMTGTITTTTEYYDFGSEVVVEIPPADQVTDLLDVIGGGAGG